MDNLEPTICTKHTIPKRARGHELCMSLLAYIDQHPDERFWQALCNWAGVYKVKVDDVTDEGVRMYNTDTFYWEGRDR